MWCGAQDELGLELQGFLSSCLGGWGREEDGKLNPSLGYRMSSKASLGKSMRPYIKIKKKKSEVVYN